MKNVDAQIRASNQEKGSSNGMMVFSYICASE